MISLSEVIWRLLTAALLGAVIGVNRGRLEWAAGLRTHMLVSVGAALAMIVSAYGFQHALTYEHVVLDPSRIAAQVISGIGFLGAGTILVLPKEQVVRGLTTAAGIWAVAAVGLAAGSGMFAAAITATVILWTILALLKPLEQRFIKPRRQPAALRIELQGGVALATLEHALDGLHVPVRQIVLRRQSGGRELADVRFTNAIGPARLDRVVEACRAVEGVGAVTVVLPDRHRD